MSAWMMNNRDLAYLALAVKRDVLGDRDPRTAAEVARVLYDQNAASVRARYGDADKSGMIQTFAYPKTCERGEQPAGVELGKLVACYRYQSCETSDYKTTEAIKLVEALFEPIVRALPGWHDAPWGDWTPASKRTTRGA